MRLDSVPVGMHAGESGGQTYPTRNARRSIVTVGRCRKQAARRLWRDGNTLLPGNHQGRKPDS